MDIERLLLLLLLTGTLHKEGHTPTITVAFKTGKDSTRKEEVPRVTLSVLTKMPLSKLWFLTFKICHSVKS